MLKRFKFWLEQHQTESLDQIQRLSIKAFSGGQTQVNKESAKKLFAKMSDTAKKKIEDLQRELKSKVDMDEEIPMDDEDESVGIDTNTVQSQWDDHVTGKKLRKGSGESNTSIH